MLEAMVGGISEIKKEFARAYDGRAHIQEVIPASASGRFQADEGHVKALHGFAQKNPIYTDSYEQAVAGVRCVVYEGDINEYWLNSIKHGSSCQPFYPTWMVSAYVIALIAQRMGYTHLVDIGSGDGRIAFCGRMLGLGAHSIEIDPTLVELQKTVADATRVDFNPECADALEYDYSGLDMERPVFVIGGLPQMGGDVLASGIIERIAAMPHVRDNAGLVLAGTHSKRQLSGSDNDGGWSALLDRYGLGVVDMVSLPTVWTFDQDADTPYMYARFSRGTPYET